MAPRNASLRCQPVAGDYGRENQYNCAVDICFSFLVCWQMYLNFFGGIPHQLSFGGKKSVTFTSENK